MAWGDEVAAGDMVVSLVVGGEALSGRADMVELEREERMGYRCAVHWNAPV
jgi:hypothetical protein